MSDPKKAELKSKAVYKAYEAHVNPGLARLLKFARLNEVEVSAEGAIIEDARGRKYIDCAGGYGVFNLGHRHPEVIKAVKNQLDKMPLASKLFLNGPMAELASILAEITPGDLQYCFFVNSGAEAVENALKLARMASGRTEIIAAQGAFHGKTFGALSASGRDVFKKPFEPLVPGFKHVPFGDIDALASTFTPQTAAVILEPIQGEGGVKIPPPGYLKAVRALCSENNVFFIADEIQTGLGRTGKLFGVDHEGVVPDLMTLGKALGGGVMPIAAVVGRPEAWAEFKKNPLVLTSTFGGNPLACAAAKAAISIIIDDNLSGRAEQLGKRLLEGLNKVADSKPRVIKDVRGRGLLAGVELTREGLGGVVVPEMIKRGVAAGYTLNLPRVVRFEPPIIIKKEMIDEIVEVFASAVDEADSLYEQLFPKPL